MIDIFANREDSQVLLVDYKSENKVKPIEDIQGQYEILDSLGTKASDILQANGIIWVEGISDVNYLRKWIHLVNPDLIENLHFCFMFYGGRNLANVTLSTKSLSADLIPLLKLNKNAFVVIDSDISEAKKQGDINDTKKRIAEEIGEGKCWITKGREIENYIHPSIFNLWRPGAMNITRFQWNQKIDTILNKANGYPDYSNNKNKYSREIAKHFTKENMNILDLECRIDDIVASIHTWNK